MNFGIRCAVAFASLALTVLPTAAQAREKPRYVEDVVVLDVADPVVPVRVVTYGCAGADHTPTLKNLEIARAATLCLLNAERAMRGLAPLRAEQPLTDESQAYSQRMVDERFFAHDRPMGYLLAGTYWVVAQNLAWGDGSLATPKSIVEGWMQSPGHRRNILEPAFTEIGIGIAPGSPDPRSRLGAATYTTDFGVIEGPWVDPVPPRQAAMVRRSVERKRCPRAKARATRGRTVELRKRIRCVRRTSTRAQWLH